MAYHYIERLGFVTRVEDLEGVLAPKLYKALLEIDNVIKYVETAGRIDRRKLLDMLTEVKDDLNNY